MALSVLPDSHALLAIIVGVSARAALLALDPLAVVLAPVFPDKLTVAVALVFLKHADVLLAVGPL